MKIIENLWQVGGDDYSAGGDAAIYLVRFGRQAALIDAGCGGGHWQVVDNIHLCLPADTQIRYLLLTHCHYDHSGGASALRDQFNCLVVAHRDDAVFLETGDSSVTAASWYGADMQPFKVDRKLSADEEALEIGDGEIRAYHCPGHSPGSVVYTTELNGQKVLFGQDVHGPLHPSLLSDRQAYQRSLQFICGLEADILCEGHFGVFQGKERVRKFIGSYME